MPIYRLYTKKVRGGYEWGNTYHVTAASEAAAATIGDNILQIERDHIWNGVNLTGVRVSTLAQDGRTGRTFPASYIGLYALPNVLQIEVCLRMQFFPGVKQSNVKYFHYFTEGTHQTDGYLDATHWTNALDFAADLLGLGVLCDTAGTIFTQVTPERNLSMHQMYRAWADRAPVEGGS